MVVFSYKIKKVVLNSTLGLTLCFSSLSVNAQWLYFTPWSGYLTGNLGLSYNISKISGSSTGTSGGVIGSLKTSLATNGFIYRPWILRSDFNASTELSHNLYNILDQEQQTFSNTLMGANFQFYPETDYGTDVELQQNLEVRSGESTNKTYRTKVRVSNRYAPRAEKYRLISSLQWTADQSPQNSYSFDRIQALSTFSQTTDNGNYSVSLRGSSNIAKVSQSIETTEFGFVNTKQKNERLNSGINYNQTWRHSANGSSSFLASYITEDNKQDTLQNKINRGQFSSFSSFTSNNDSRLNYNINFLASSTRLDSMAITELKTTTIESQTENYNSNLSFNFDYNDSLRFSGSIGANQTIKEITKNSSFSEYISASYSDNIALSLGSSYGWNGTLSLKGTQTSNTAPPSDQQHNLGDTFSMNPSLNHSFRKDLILWSQPIKISLHQGIRHEISDRDISKSSQWLLNQTASFSWFQDIDATSSSLTLSLSDYRHLNDQVAQEQGVYIYFQRGTELSADSSWGGSLTYEWRNNTDADSIKTTTNNASGSMWFTAKDLFGVPRLVFRSTIELPINELLFDDKERNNKVTNWQNRLDFRMGLLEATAQMDMTLDSYNISISIKRYFGMPL